MSAPRWNIEGRDWPHREASRFVTAGGLTWHVQIIGSGPVALLIHGTGAATHSWRDVAPLLAERMTVVAIDLPGHGFTSALDRSGPPEVARAIATLITALDVTPALIVGHSVGAAIALTMVHMGLAQPKAVVSLGGALLPFPGMAGQLFPMLARGLFANPFTASIAALALANAPGGVAAFLRRSTSSPIDARGVALYERLLATSGHVGGALALMANWQLEPLERALPGITVPVLLVHGDRDSTIPIGTSYTVVKRLPHARVHPQPGLGHLAHEEDPAGSATLILDFAVETGILAAVPEGAA